MGHLSRGSHGPATVISLVKEFLLCYAKQRGKPSVEPVGRIPEAPLVDFGS